MIKLSPVQFISLFNNSSSIIKTVERIILIEERLNSNSWYAIKASINHASELQTLEKEFIALRLAFNNSNLTDLHAEQIKINERINQCTVSSYVQAIGRQFLMAKRIELSNIIKLKKILNTIPPLDELKKNWNKYSSL